jgi:hypothetical protein
LAIISNAIVDMYATASRLKLRVAMNVILDAFLADVASNEIFPETLVVYIYEKTEKDCGLRRWLMEQVTISVDAEDFEGYSLYWPHEALVDLAIHCMGRYIPPNKIENIAKYYQSPFNADSHSE